MAGACNGLEAAEPLLLVALAEHSEEELQVQSLPCSVAQKVVALDVLVQMALKGQEADDDASAGVVGGEEEIGFFVAQ